MCIRDRTCISFVFNFQCCWSHPWLENAPILCSQYRLWHAFGVENILCGKTTRNKALILFCCCTWKFDAWPQKWSSNIVCSKLYSWFWGLFYISVCFLLYVMINMVTLQQCSRTWPVYSTSTVFNGTETERNTCSFLLQHFLLKCVWNALIIRYIILYSAPKKPVFL